MKKDRVIFLCTANAVRSQMAEAFLRKHGDNRYEAYSAGLEPKPIDPMTILVMEEVGIDMSEHRAKSLREYMGQMVFAHMITVCEYTDQNCPTTLPGVMRRAHWPFDDPIEVNAPDEARLAKFREVRDAVEQRVQAWLRETAPTQMTLLGDEEIQEKR